MTAVEAIDTDPKTLETVVSVRLDRGLDTVMRSAASARGVSVSAMLRVAIDVVLAMTDDEFAAQMICRSCSGTGRRTP